MMGYTVRHRRAFRETERRLTGRVSTRGRLHDLDKLFLYPLLGVGPTNRLHRLYARHHARRARTEADYAEMAVDWECARLTKPDKPLDAYDTLYRLYPELVPVMLPVLGRLGLDRAGPGTTGACGPAVRD